MAADKVAPSGGRDHFQFPAACLASSAAAFTGSDMVDDLGLGVEAGG